MKHEMALQWPKCTQCSAQHQQQAQQCVQGTYVKTRVLAVGALASTTCNNFIADLLLLSEVTPSLLVAGPPCVHPYLGYASPPLPFPLAVGLRLLPLAGHGHWL
jgi:hypothetical protein